MAGPAWAIIVAAGQGSRFGGPKQFAVVDNRTVLAMAVSSVIPSVDGVVVVLPPDLIVDGEMPAECLERYGVGPEITKDRHVAVAAGGATRAGSVRSGLARVPAECEVVVVHDAARPLASEVLCETVLAAVRAGADGAIPGVSIADTVKRVSGERVVDTLDRSELVNVQTPQAFSAHQLRRAHEGEPEATDDAALVESAGGTVVVVRGEDSNVKITSFGDLDLVAWWHRRLRGSAAMDAVT